MKRKIKILIFIFLISCLFNISIIKAEFKDKIREERYNICKEMYYKNKDYVDKKYKHKNQNIISRCATYMTLIYAYESNYWKSKICLIKKNCYWIKWAWPFRVYNTYYDWDIEFAKLYFKFNFNKNITDFIKWYFIDWIWKFWWSWDSLDKKEKYIQFIKNRYWGIYNYFEKLWN